MKIDAKEDYQFLASDVVLCTLSGKYELEMKSGDKIKMEPYVGTIIFKKKGNDWKIIYEHETAGSPTPVK